MSIVRILRKPEVEQRTGLSGSSIDRFEASGNFPVRLRVSQGAVGWMSNEVDDWIASRPRGEFDAALPPVEQVQSLKRQIKAHENSSTHGANNYPASKRSAQRDEIAQLEKLADEKLTERKLKRRK